MNTSSAPRVWPAISPQKRAMMRIDFSPEPGVKATNGCMQYITPFKKPATLTNQYGNGGQLFAEDFDSSSTMGVVSLPCLPPRGVERRFSPSVKPWSMERLVSLRLEGRRVSESRVIAGSSSIMCRLSGSVNLCWHRRSSSLGRQFRQNHEINLRQLVLSCFRKKADLGVQRLTFYRFTRSTK